MTHSTGSPAAGGAEGKPCNPVSGSARWDLASHLRLWPVAAVGLAIDLWTKDWAFSQLDPRNGQVIIAHLARFQRSLNTGALFGLGKGWTPLFIAASLAALGFVLYLFVHSTRDRRSLHVALALVLAGALGNLYDRAFVIADIVTYTNKGTQHTTVGKVIDTDERGGKTVGSYPDGLYPQRIPAVWQPQVRQQGVVRDFVKIEPRIHIGDRYFDVWPWVFNVADALLVVGVVLLMLNFWWERRAERAAARASAEVADAPGAQRECGT